MSTKSGSTDDDDYDIEPTGIERVPPLPAVPPVVSGSWGGGGDVGGGSGAGVGTSVGIGVGTSVGVGVGTSVGIGVGTSVGIGVGTSVGIGVGTSVGIGVGTSVGIGVGAAAGLAGGGGGEPGGFLDVSAAGAHLRQVLLLARQVELMARQGAAADGGDRLVPRDLWTCVRLAQPALSPCGTWVAFVKLERPLGGALQTERIYLKRVGSLPGQKEYPVTDTSVLADSPVWRPHVFDGEASRPGPDDRPGAAELLFRARATAIDVLQLHVVEIDLPTGVDDAPPRIGRVRGLSSALTHPWAPKWRRFLDGRGQEQNRIYYVAATPEPPPAGYDHLVYDDALVGWWDSLRLPHQRWRFYEIDAHAVGAPRDLLGPHQPLLDFVNGVWTCWDVHPGGREIVWAAVNRASVADRAGAAPRWPNEITLDLFRLRLEGDPGAPATVMCLTDRISPAAQVAGSEASGPVRGRHDDYMPLYAPDGRYIVYAEKQFSTLPADYPRIVRMNVDAFEKPTIIDGEDVFEVIKTRAGTDGGGQAAGDTVLPHAWRFSAPDELLVIVEDAGRHRLKRLAVPDHQLAGHETNEPGDIDARGDALAFAEESGSVHDFDVQRNPARGQDLQIAAVTSSISRPPELRFPPLPANATMVNHLLKQKCAAIGVTELRVPREATLSRRLYGPARDEVQTWLVCPSAVKDAVASGAYQGHEKYPLVHLLHGGPHSAWIDEFHSRFNAALLASQGYIVALVNFRGSTGTPEGEPMTVGAAPVGAESTFLRRLKAAPAADVDGIVAEAVRHMQGSSGDEDERGKIRNDVAKGYLHLRHLRKIERHADRERFVAFVQALEPEHYARLVQRADQSDLHGWGSAMSDIDQVTAALLERGYVDPDRLAVIGGSYGAYLGARLLGWRDREHAYKAYVLHAGVYDALSHFGADAFWVQYQNFGDRPWVRQRADERLSPDFDDGDPDHWQRFSRISPLLRSQRLAEDVHTGTAPAVLITHGLADLRVHWHQSVLLHRMLKDRGARSRLVLYPGLGHRLDQPEPSVQWWTAALAWLRDHGVAPGGR